MKLGNRHFEVKARCDLGLLYHLAGEHRLAQEELTHVLALIEGHGDLRFEALVSTRLGYALEASHQLDDARRMYERGCTLHRADGAGLLRPERTGRNGAPGERGKATTPQPWPMPRRSGMPSTASAQTQPSKLRAPCAPATRFSANRTIPGRRLFSTPPAPNFCARAETIDDPEHRGQFWQLADHRFFQEADAQANLT